MMGLYRRDPQGTITALSAILRDANRDAASKFAPFTRDNVTRVDPRLGVVFNAGGDLESGREARPELQGC